MTISVHLGDCVAWLRAYDGPLFDACVTDPPYHLSSIVKRFGGENAAPAKSGKTGAYARASKGFMGKTWDGGDVAFRPETWRAIYDKLKPGAHLVAFSGTRTYHRMVCAIEDAGFEIRDQLAWMFGSGFPKSHDVSKGIDKAAGDFQEPSGIRKLTGKARIKGGGGSGRGYEYGELREFIETFDKSASQLSAEWQGWGSALKPAFEPICLARKPLSEKTIAANVLKWGTGAINVDACRVNWQSEADAAAAAGRGFTNSRAQGKTVQSLSIGKESRGGKNTYNPDKLIGRWPANVIHDGGAEVLAGFPVTRAPSGGSVRSKPAMIYGGSATTVAPSDNGGSAARFFYSAKAGPLDRLGTAHPTVKPVDLMRWLCRMITPPGGHILEPFAGSGKTGIAAMAEGFDCTMIDIEAEHIADIERQLAYLRGEGATTFAVHNANLLTRADSKPLGGLFDFFSDALA